MTKTFKSWKPLRDREILLDDIALVFKRNQEEMLRAEDLLEENESLDAFVWVRRLFVWVRLRDREILLDDIASVFKRNQEEMLRAEDLLEENESLDAFVWVRRLADTLIVLAEGTLGGYYGDALRKERAGVREAFGYPDRD